MMLGMIFLGPLCFLDGSMLVLCRRCSCPLCSRSPPHIGITRQRIRTVHNTLIKILKPLGIFRCTHIFFFCIYFMSNLISHPPVMFQLPIVRILSLYCIGALADWPPYLQYSRKRRFHSCHGRSCPSVCMHS